MLAGAGGSATREERRRVVHAFMNDPDVVVLIANDAAGEGVNLQRAHLMINYDLPWKPRESKTIQSNCPTL